MKNKKEKKVFTKNEEKGIIRLQSLPLEYQSPYLGVPWRYLNMRLTAFRCDSLGFDW